MLTMSWHDAGLKFLYVLCWILHRDINLGNILISTPLSYDPEKDMAIGRLIDLDHAKAANSVYPLYLNSIEGIHCQEEDTVINVLAFVSGAKLEDDVVRRICRRIWEDRPETNSADLVSMTIEYKNHNSALDGNKIATQASPQSFFNVVISHTSLH